MTNKVETNGKCKKGRVMLYISLFGFTLYVANVVIHKANIVFGWKIWNLGNVGEFLLLFLASTILTIAAMQREVALGNGNRSETPSLKGENA